MCYDISFSSSIELITDYLPDISIECQIEIGFDSTLHVQAQAYRKYPIIMFEDDKYKLKCFEWGVIADYMDTPEKVKKNRQWMCNAQSEKVLDDKKSYWHRIRRKRCLIPVTGIFEHREIKGWKNKVPYFVRVKERPLFCIPGLYHYAPIPDVETGEVRGTFTLITRAANDVMRMIHNGGPNAYRMPLFLPNKEAELQWLKPDLTDEGIKEILNYELPGENLDYHPTWTIRSTKPHPTGGNKIDPYEWPNLPELGNDEGTVKAVELF
jgi:putative SOS response-associated peptidase YedK